MAVRKRIIDSELHSVTINDEEQPINRLLEEDFMNQPMDSPLLADSLKDDEYTCSFCGALYNLCVRLLALWPSYSKNCLLLLLKIVIVALTFIMVLGLGVMTKLSIFGIAGHLAPLTYNISQQKHNVNLTLGTQQSVAFVQLLLLLEIPQIITILWTFIKGVIGKSNEHYPWPYPMALILGGVMSVMEAAVISAFTIIVASQAGAVAIVLSSGIFVCGCTPTLLCCGFDKMCRPVNNEFCRGSIVRLYIALGTLFQLLGISLLTFPLSYSLAEGYVSKESLPQYIALVTVLMIPLCMIVLSCLWTPLMQMLTYESKGNFDEVSKIREQPKFWGTYKGDFIYAIIRAILIPFFCFAWARLIHIYPDIIAGFLLPNWISAWFSTSLFIVALTGILINGYIFSFFGLLTFYRFWTFLVPLLLVPYIAVGFFWIFHSVKPNALSLSYEPSFQLVGLVEKYEYVGHYYIPTLVIGGFLLFLGQILSVSLVRWMKLSLPYGKENFLFLSNRFDAVFMESSLLLNHISGVFANRGFLHKKKGDFSKLYICTTMYQESIDEMKKYLYSLKNVAKTMPNCDQLCEAHIFFDSAVNGEEIGPYALDLMSLVLKDVPDLRKYSAPYGMQFQGHLENTLRLTIHLKDSFKARLGRRWSKVMYMDYVVRSAPENPKSTFILATDADVEFDFKAIKALMNVVLYKDDVAAASGRICPTGSGPLVWYQQFENSLVYWFQKVAEQIIGCVLSSPGQFSVYRVKALQEVLREYKTEAITAKGYLMKDLGEDRWLSSLFIKKGWLLEYTDLAYIKTTCPDLYTHFILQRRRWISSTFISLNTFLINYCQYLKSNKSINIVFYIYQSAIFLLFSILPGTIILFLSSAILGTDAEILGIILGIIVILYGLICMTCSERCQIYVGISLALLISILMSVAVGLVTHAGVSSLDDLVRHTTSGPTVTVNALFLGLFVVSISIAIGLQWKFIAFWQIIWFIIGLPGVYLILFTYTICNLNRVTWGSRKGIEISYPKLSSLIKFFKPFKSMFILILSKLGKKVAKEELTSGLSIVESMLPEVEEEELDIDFDDLELLEWLKDGDEWKVVIEKFKKNGYTKLHYIKHMDRMDLTAIGISGGHLAELERRIMKLNIDLAEKEDGEAEREPLINTVGDFLQRFYLEEFEDCLKSEGYFSKSPVSDLYIIDEIELKRMGITKRAHVRQFLYGIKMLTNPQDKESKLWKLKTTISALKVHKGENIWDDVFENNPHLANELDHSVLITRKIDLTKLRNTYVLTLLVINTSWIALMLSAKTAIPLSALSILQPEVSLVYLGIYLIIIVFQEIILVIFKVKKIIHSKIYKVHIRDLQKQNKHPNRSQERAPKRPNLEESA